VDDLQVSVLDCSTAGQTILEVSCMALREAECIATIQALYGCGGSCGGPALLAEAIAWGAIEGYGECFCVESMLPPEDGECLLEEDWIDCVPYQRATFTLPFGCEELGYDVICAEATCSGEGEVGAGASSASCAPLTLPAEVRVEEAACAEVGGCAVAVGERWRGGASGSGVLLALLALCALASRSK
jgi:hypothetical protein